MSNQLTYADLDGDGEVTPGEILEENNYYPFGLKHQGNNELAGDKHKYKFLNKEYQPELGLNTIATDYRHYDSALGRFNNMDALSELAPSQTPYRYGFNNPVYWTDPTGLFESYGAAQQWANSQGFNVYEITRSKGIYSVESGGISYYIDRGSFYSIYMEGNVIYSFKNELIMRPGGNAGGGPSSGSSGSPAGNGPGGPSSGAAPGAPGGFSGAGTSSNQSIEFISSVGTATSIVEQGAKRGERLYNRQSAYNSKAVQKAAQSAKVAKWMGRASNAVNIIAITAEFINTVNNPNATGADYAKIGAKIGVAYLSNALNVAAPGLGIVVGIGLNYLIDEYGEDAYESITDSFNNNRLVL